MTEETYAQALYDLAKEEGLEKSVLEELAVLEVSFAQTPEFVRLLASPNVSKQERCQILDDSFRGKVQPYVLNYLKILTEKGYIRHFSGCCRAYREQYNRDNGILCVRAVTAQALSQEQLMALTRKLTKVTGKSVTLECTVDPQCLGGIRLDYDGKRVDGTVQSRLESIAKLLKNTML